MCGLIAAFSGATQIESEIRQAMARMHARGPDGEGLWQEPGVCLGHRRLAILDLDMRAAQPMHSNDDRYVIVFNGEIYNFCALRKQLQGDGAVFRTESDTEVLLELFVRHGEHMLAMLHGMFALVIWDRHTRRAFATRDPYGIKPLYLACIENGVMLASQVKALLATGLVSREPDVQGQAGFWMLGSVPEPHTWYRDIRAVRAGHAVWIEGGQVIRDECWADIGAAWRDASACVAMPDAEVRERVASALRESVERHLVADVPVAVFLSGGIDSGALAGLMVEAGARDLQGITIAYDEFAGSHDDEAPVAAAIAAHYGIAHHIRRVGKDEFLADLPRILDAMDQPSIDGVNTWYASKAVAELGLKVVVSGVGGDELFQGYPSFKQLPRMQRRWHALSAVPGMQTVGKLAGTFQAWRSGNARWRHAADWARSIEGAWWLRRSVHTPEALPALMGEAIAAEALDGFSASDWVQAMTGPLASESMLAVGQLESLIYMRNQLLRDSDWASMDHSVELRTPLVDAHLLQQLTPLLVSFKQFPNKSLLAEAPVKPLPRAIIERRKTGFGIPVARWLEATGNDRRSDWQQRVAQAYGLPIGSAT